MDLILMASGNAKRFGKNKLLENIGEKKVYEYAASTFLQVKSFQHKIIVSQYDEILEAMKKKGYISVRNCKSELGISESIKLGLTKLQNRYEMMPKLKTNRDGIMFAVCDQPFLTAKTVEEMAMEFLRLKEECLQCNAAKQKQGDFFPILRTEHEKQLGNPVIFDFKYIDELLKLEGDVGGRQVICNHKESLRTFHIEDIRELMDIDTLEDLLEIEKTINNE